MYSQRRIIVQGACHHSCHVCLVCLVQTLGYLRVVYKRDYRNLCERLLKVPGVAEALQAGRPKGSNKPAGIDDIREASFLPGNANTSIVTPAQFATR